MLYPTSCSCRTNIEISDEYNTDFNKDHVIDKAFINAYKILISKIIKISEDKKKKDSLIKEIKTKHPEIGIQCDVALDPYTTHGHDGILDAEGNIQNDATVDILCQQALVQADAGCDIISPSDMMDGRIGAIRKTLDKNNFEKVQILSYAVKYSSNFYGPFRDAIGSRKKLKGDKKSYQMDFKNSNEALRAVSYTHLRAHETLS